MTTTEQLEAILKRMKVEEYGTVSLKDTVAAITALIQEAEKNVAEWFEEGVPTGFTTETWLTAYRKTPELTGSGGSNNE